MMLTKIQGCFAILHPLIYHKNGFRKVIVGYVPFSLLIKSLRLRFDRHCIVRYTGFIRFQSCPDRLMDRWVTYEHCRVANTSEQLLPWWFDSYIVSCSLCFWKVYYGLNTGQQALMYSYFPFLTNVSGFQSLCLVISCLFFCVTS